MRIHWKHLLSTEMCAKSDLEPFQQHKINTWYEFRNRFLHRILTGMISETSIRFFFFRRSDTRGSGTHGNGGTDSALSVLNPPKKREPTAVTDFGKCSLVI